jgi:hypothetical protein
MPTIRRAHARDLAQVYGVLYDNDVANDPHPPPPGEVPTYLRHVLQTGVMYVAEGEGEILAFAALIRRGTLAFLTDLFVRRRVQSSHLGTSLLRQILPEDSPVSCTMSSTDPRALALYIRAGMRPHWPHFCLRAMAPAPGTLPTTDVEIVEARTTDPEILRWDAELCGRQRPEDHAYWVRDEGAIPLWFSRHGQVVGYGYVRLRAGTLWYPDALTIGPLGVRAVEDAASCVVAAVAWARPRAAVLRINVPGPHPGLAPLLAAGFRITYVETFVSSAAEPFFDAQRYLASGSDLL